MAVQIAAPARVPYRYGLLSVAQITEYTGSLRIPTDYTFDTVACNTGTVWDPECAPEFTVTFTRTENPDEVSVTATPGAGNDYEYNLNGGAFVTLTATITSVLAAPVTVVVRESAGLQRSVTRTDVSFDSPEGTQYVFQSEQTANEPKTLTEGIGNSTASPFVVIGGVNCMLAAGYDWEALAEEAFTSVEQRLVEQRFWEAQLATSTPTLPVGATPQSVVDGVAVLEEFLRDNTGYEGALHTSSYLGAHVAAADVVTETASDTRKYTELHTPVAFGGGYPRTGPTGQGVPSASQAWMFATGAVVVARGELLIPGAGIADRADLVLNQEYVIVERTYAVLSDCPTAAVLVDTSV